MIILLFRIIDNVLTKNHDNMNDIQLQFSKFIDINLLFNNKYAFHLPVPIFSYIKPTFGRKFILRIMLSIGRFETEIDLIFHPTIRKV